MTVAGVFGPGFDGGRGHYQLNGGTLIANGSWELTHNGGVGTMDITAGVFIKNGDASSQVSGFISGGRLTAYAGEGKIVFDYNVTNPGKTTVTAVAPVEGDLDKDFDVDIDDLEIMAADWLYSDCASVANLDQACRVDLGDFAVLAANWMSGFVTHWHVAETLFPTDDLIVTPHYAENFGIIGDGMTDVTDELQAA